MDTGTYRGHDGYLEMIAAWGEAWQRVEAEIVGVDELDAQHLLTEIHQRAVGAGSGVPVEMTLFWLFSSRRRGRSLSPLRRPRGRGRRACGRRLEP